MSKAEQMRTVRPTPMTKLAGASTMNAAITYVTARAKRGELMPKTASNFRIVLCHFAEVVGNPDASAITRRHIEKYMELPGAPATRRYRFTHGSDLHHVATR